MPELRTDLNQALSKAFVLSILGTMLCVLLSAFSDVLRNFAFYYLSPFSLNVFIDEDKTRYNRLNHGFFHYLCHILAVETVL